MKICGYILVLDSDGGGGEGGDYTAQREAQRPE